MRSVKGRKGVVRDMVQAGDARTANVATISKPVPVSYSLKHLQECAKSTRSEMEETKDNFWKENYENSTQNLYLFLRSIKTYIRVAKMY
jgi:hypothetical protein